MSARDNDTYTIRQTRYLRDTAEDFITVISNSMAEQLPKPFLASVRQSLVDHTTELLLERVDTSLSREDLDARLENVLACMYQPIRDRIARTYRERTN